MCNLNHETRLQRNVALYNSHLRSPASVDSMLSRCCRKSRLDDLVDVAVEGVQELSSVDVDQTSCTILGDL